MRSMAVIMVMIAAIAVESFGGLITVLNSSFEDTAVTASGGYARYDQGAPGTNWSYSIPNSVNTAILLIDTDVYTLVPVPAGYDGSQIVSLSARKLTTADYGTPNTIYQQVMGGTGQPALVTGQDLTLTVSLANLSSSATLQNFSFGLYADAALTQVLAERVSTTSAPIALSTTAFNDFTVEWTVDEANAGKAVYIGFKVAQYGTAASTARLGIDNVRLDVIPEPATIGTMFLGGLFAIAGRRFVR